MTRADVVDLFDVQAYIAGELAGRAASVLSAADVARMRAVQVVQEAAAARGDVQQVRLNHEIHRTVNLCAGPTRLTVLLGQLVGFVPVRFFGEVEGWSQASAHDHDGIFDALEAGDAAGARTAMPEHIRHVGELLSAHLDRQGIFDGQDLSVVVED